MYRVVRFLHVGLIVAIAAIAMLPALVRAQSDATIPEFVLQPADGAGSYFALTLEAGETKTLKVNLGNAGGEPVEARSYAADAYTLVNGGFGVRPDGEPVSGSTQWLDYPSETLTLEPGKLIERELTVTVPDDAAPGQYISGLVLQTAEPIAVSGSEMLRQTILKSIAVFITVPGPITPELTIGGLSVNAASGSNVLQIELGNPGNVLLKPAGEVIVTDATGATVITAPVAMGSVYAGMDTILEISVPATVAPGAYAVSVQLKDEETGAEAEADLSLELTAPTPDATPIASPVTIDGVTLDPSRDNTSGGLRFVTVNVALSNTAEPLTSARLTLHVTRDGVLVEDFPLNASLVVPNGVSEVQARYLPAEDWTAGTYAFSVTLESIDPGTGQATVIAIADAPETVVGP